MAVTTYVAEFNQYSVNTADSLGGLQLNPVDPYHNDQYDAYRHTLISAKLTERFGPEMAKWLMDNYEAEYPNIPRESNMDYYNNNVGRFEYLQWERAQAAGQTTKTQDT